MITLRDLRCLTVGIEYDLVHSGSPSTAPNSSLKISLSHTFFSYNTSIELLLVYTSPRLRSCPYFFNGTRVMTAL